MSSTTPRTIILKLEVGASLVDSWRDWLVEAGYQVVRAAGYAEGARLAEHLHPALIMIKDDQKKGLDAIKWLEAQHAHTDPSLPLIPLLIITDKHHREAARLQELPDRVRVLERPLRPEVLLQTVQTMIDAWR
jgi:DNA-binding response OmpR family regulator